MSLKFSLFLDSFICHQIVYKLCTHCELEWEQFLIMTLEGLNSINYRLQASEISSCIRLLERRGWVVQEHKPTPELIECIESVNDKRVKDKTKYCLRKRKGKIVNIIRATPELCAQFNYFLQEQKYIVKYPVFSCK